MVLTIIYYFSQGKDVLKKSKVLIALEWKFKGLSAEIIEPSSTFDNSLASALSYFGNKERSIFDGSC